MFRAPEDGVFWERAADEAGHPHVGEQHELLNQLIGLLGGGQAMMVVMAIQRQEKMKVRDTYIHTSYTMHHI
jgi:hypothetical protein